MSVLHYSCHQNQCRPVCFQLNTFSYCVLFCIPCPFRFYNFERSSWRKKCICNRCLIFETTRLIPLQALITVVVPKAVTSVEMQRSASS